jgi:predicted nucleic acid-binding protein
VIAYVDTSVLIKLVVEEPGSDDAARIWDAADTVVCTRLLFVEARAALAMAHRLHRLTAARHRRAVRELADLSLQLTIVEMTAELVDAAGDLAEAHALRGYDAVHLAAALTLGDPVFASADRDLCAAASRHGLAVAAPGIDRT